MINDFDTLDVRLYERDRDLYQSRFEPFEPPGKKTHISAYRQQVAADFETYNALYDEFLAYRVIFSDKNLIPVKRLSIQTGQEEWTVPALCNRPEPTTDKEEEDDKFLHLYYINAWVELQTIIDELASTNYVQFKYRYCRFLSSDPTPDVKWPDTVERYGDYYLVKTPECTEAYKRLLYAMVYSENNR